MSGLDDAVMVMAALAYASYGWPVFPLHTPVKGGCSCRKPDCRDVGKHPRTRNGLTDATADEKQIRAWWAMWPNANIGIACGASGLVVLDVDPRHSGDESYRDLVAKFGAEAFATRTALTGGGGEHRVFIAPPEPSIRNSAGLLGPGLDIRGDGGFIVAPPSLHESGRLYEWEDAAVPLAPFPAALTALLGAARKQREESAPGAAIPEGERNSTLASLAGSMRFRGMPEGAILAALRVTNKEQCSPPLTDREVRAIAASIGKYSPGAKASPGAGAGSAAKPGTFTPHIISAAALQALEIPDLQWAVPGLIPQGLTILAGKPKSGKSWLALNVGLSIAGGGKVLGDGDAESGDVLYLALEDSKRRLKDRIASVLQGVVSPARLHLTTEWPRFGDGGEVALAEWLTAHPDCRLLILDTLARVRPARGRNGNSYDEDYAALGAIKALADRFAVAVLVIHHTRKMPSDDPLDLISGTLAVAGAADALLILIRSGEATGIDAKLHVRGRDMEDADLAMRWWRDRCQWEVAGDWEAARASGHKTAILAALADGPLSLKDLASATGIEYRTLDKTVRRLVLNAYVLRDGRTYKSPHKPFVRNVRNESENFGHSDTGRESPGGDFGHSDTSDTVHRNAHTSKPKSPPPGAAVTCALDGCDRPTTAGEPLCFLHREQEAT